jgi:hypothetical protein
MIDPLSEDLITPVEAARMLPRGRTGKPVHVSGVYRLMSRGCRGVVLERLCGPRICTSRQAVARFLSRLNSEAAGPVPATPSCPGRERSGRRVDDELDRLGL